MSNPKRTQILVRKLCDLLKCTPQELLDAVQKLVATPKKAQPKKATPKKKDE